MRTGQASLNQEAIIFEIPASLRLRARHDFAGDPRKPVSHKGLEPARILRRREFSINRETGLSYSTYATSIVTSQPSEEAAKHTNRNMG